MICLASGLGVASSPQREGRECFLKSNLGQLYSLPVSIERCSGVVTCYFVIFVICLYQLLQPGFGALKKSLSLPDAL